MSSRSFKSAFTRPTSLALAAAVTLCLASAVLTAQYPGQIAKKGKDTPQLRAVAVLEWTGDPGKPKTSRLVPITVYDGQALQDGNVYLARPQPLALAGEVEYELEQNGKPIGLYDIKHAGQEQGMWVGYGSWKAMPSAKLTAPKPIVDSGFDPNDDKPVLHRRHADSGSSDSSAPSAPSDPDRPTLHKKSGSDDSNKGDSSKGDSTKGDSSKGDSSKSDSASASGSASDPDRPTLHKKDAGSSSTIDPNHPVLHTHDDVASDDGKHSSFNDPDRPRLMRGKSTASGSDVLPSLMGMPPDMQQAVAVSDVTSHPEHPWNYTWANPADEDKMKAALEDMARQALGLQAPAPPAAPKHSTTRSTTRATTRAHAKPAPPSELPPLVDEHFRVFELAYGGGATMVLSARTDGPPREQKFITLIAQPDLYGNPLVLLKSVTDGAHLDETPRMRLVDAVDVMADNRGELLFELRGNTQRQFALYRVLRGTAEKLFVTGSTEYGSAPGE